MQRGILKGFRNNVKHWYIPGIIGLLFIGVGIYTFMSPLNSYLALSIIFSISFIVAGISDISFSLMNKDTMDNWGWNLAFGILSLIIGIMLIINPELSIVTLPFYVGFLILFRSIAAIGFSLDLKSFGVSDWGVLLALGILGTIFSFILIWNPTFAGLTIVVWTGLALLSSGIFSIYLSFKLKQLKDAPDRLPADLRARLTQLEREIDETDSI